MSLQRKAIRHFFADLLKGRTIAGNQVFTSRTDPFRPDTDPLPAIVVFTLDEDAEVYQNAPRTYGVTAEVAFELFVEEQPETATATAEDQLDDLAAQIKCLVGPCIPQLQGIQIEGQEPLSVNPDKSGYLRTDVEFDARGRQIVGAERMVYGVYYGLDDDESAQAKARPLRKVGVTWDFPPPDGDPEAQDEIDVPQG